VKEKPNFVGPCSLDIICALLTSPSTRYKALQQFITQCCFADVVEMLNDYLCGASSKPFDIESDLEMLSSTFRLLSAVLLGDKGDDDDDDDGIIIKWIAVVEELPELLNGLKDHISKQQMNELNIDDQTTVDGLLQQIDVLLGACEF
jgi:hypothetical protein